MYLHVIEGDVDLVTVLVHQHGVTMREGGAANILTTDTNIVTLETVDNQGILYTGWRQISEIISRNEPDKVETQ